MTDLAVRMTCPACLGVGMQKVPVTPELDIDHCGRCGGNWILHRDTPRLVAVPRAAAHAALGGVTGQGFLCHGCHAPLKRNAPACRACGWSNVLDCPGCGTPMPRKLSRGVTVDVCGGCRGVWLDYAELATLWAAAAGALVHTSGGNRAMYAGVDAADVLFDTFWYAPDLAAAAVHGTAELVGAGWEAALHLPAVLSHAPDALPGLLELAGHAAGAVFGFIAELIAGIFDGV
jgi:Zn-finger nucleic acid-binding protein